MMGLHSKTGFTLTEVIVAMVIVGTASLLLLPKVMNKPNVARENTAISESFHTFGSQWVKFKKEYKGSLTWPSNPKSPDGVARDFHEYLYTHVTWRYSRPPRTFNACFTYNNASTTDPNDDALITMYSGAQIIRICPMANGAVWSLTVEVPRPKSTPLSYELYVTPDSDRYTTSYGYTSSIDSLASPKASVSPASCNPNIDPILKIVDACP